MKAWVSHRPGGPETLVWQELPDPVPAEGEVLVKIAAVGVNYPDGLLIRDLYQVRPERPFVPGSEFCGVVEQAGPGVSGLREGDLVIGRCGWGAMADRIAVAEQRCVRVPADQLLGGEEGQGFGQLMGQLPYERMLIAVPAAATIELALQLTLDYARERKVFGAPLLDMQNTRFKLAEVATIAHVVRTFVNDCTQRLVINTVTANPGTRWRMAKIA